MFIYGAFFMPNQASQSNQVEFTDIQSQEIQDFEQEIVYLYGAKDIVPIAEEYLKALEAFEESEPNEPSLKGLQHLEAAYLEVSKQTGMKFDCPKAARIEYNLILAQSQQKDFETIKSIMIDLYQIVFNTESFHIHKAAMLRTFLYQYKVALLKNKAKLTPKDKDIMLTIAKESEEQLNQLSTESAPK